MNLFGLEGSGFLLSVCLTLFLSGMIVFYVRQSLNEQNNKLANMLSIVQGMNSIPRPMNPGVGNGGQTHKPNVVSGGSNNQPQLFTANMQPITEESSQENDKIDVSDDDSHESSTTDDSDNEDFEVEIDDNENLVDITENKNDNDDADDDDADDDDADDDDADDDDDDDNVDEVKTNQDIKEIVIDPTNTALLENEQQESDSPDSDSPDNDSDDDDEEKSENQNEEDVSNLDEMLFDLIKKHEDKSKNSTANLSNMKVGELRQLIKDKNIKVNNLSKLKKDECIELLS